MKLRIANKAKSGIILLFLISSFAFGQGKAKYIHLLTGGDSLLIKNNIKSVEKYLNQFTGDTLINNEKMIEYLLFSKAGDLVLDSVIYNSLCQKREFYDDNKVKSETVRGKEGKLHSKILYDKQGNIESRTDFDAKTTDRYKYYYANNKLIKVITYRNDSIIIDSTITKYNISGKVIEKHTYSLEDDQVEIIYSYSYSNKNLLQGDCSTYGNVTWCANYEYDTINNRGDVKITTHITGTGGRTDSDKILIQDKDGKILEQIQDESKTKYIYSADGRISRIENSTMANKIIGYGTVSYNTDGTLNKTEGTSLANPAVAQKKVTQILSYKYEYYK